MQSFNLLPFIKAFSPKRENYWFFISFLTKGPLITDRNDKGVSGETYI